MSEATSHKPSLKGLAKRQSVEVSGGSLVREDPIAPGQVLPLRIQPAAEGVDLISWAAKNHEHIRAKLIEHGGIQFRGFGIGSAAELESFVQTIAGEAIEYGHRVTKRTQVSGNIYTSTDHPPSLRLGLHNETSYTRTWPMKIAFLCMKKAPQGGETPIADSRKILARVPEPIRRRFQEKKLMYLRNSGNAIELSWQETFQTDERAKVEEYCRAHGFDFEWRPDGQVRTRQVCQAVATHPVTGEQVWFNQAHLFHSSCYQPGVRERMFKDTPEEDLPMNVFYGDGSPIDPNDLKAIQEAMDEVMIVFPWEEGDILLLDNMLTAHGRMPFQGERKVVVAMAEPRSSESE